MSRRRVMDLVGPDIDPPKPISRGNKAKEEVSNNPSSPTTVDDKPIGWRWKPMSTAELMEADFRLTWLVENVFVAGQPMLIGAPKKCLKTSIAVDLGVSLATATDFLDKFPVPSKKRVAIISGESGGATIRRTYQQICDERGLDRDVKGLSWQFDIPKLGCTDDLELLSKGLREDGIDVVVLDPMYLMIMAGAPISINTGNVLQFGPLVKRAMDACLNAGAVPVAIHHAKKMSSRQGNRQGGYEPLDLDDLSQTGFAEHARQWILLNRREKYDGEGVHRLYMSVGGSVGHSRECCLDVDEGKMDSRFGGKKWIPTVLSMSEAIDEQEKRKLQRNDSKEAEKATKAAKQLDDDVHQVLLAVDHHRQMQKAAGEEVDYPIQADIKDRVAVRANRLKPAILEAVRRKQLEEVPVIRIRGKGAPVPQIGYRRPTRIESAITSED